MKHIRTSRNCDRYAVCELNKPRKEKAPQQKRSAQREVVVDEYGKIIIGQPACLPPMKAACDRLVA